MDDDELLETFAANGVSERDIAEIRNAQRQQQRIDAAPEIQPANVLIVNLFYTCQYWIRAGMEGQKVGLDPVMVEARANKMVWYQELDSHTKEHVWRGLDVMAGTCIKAWQAERKRNQ